MKKSIFIWAIAIILGATNCAATHVSNSVVIGNEAAAGVRIKGSGVIISKIESISNNYSSIRASRGVKVIMTDTESKVTKIEADDNVMPYVRVYVKDGVLNVHIDNEVKTISNCTVRVTVPANNRISSINAVSAAEVSIQTSLSCGELEINGSSAGEVNFTKPFKADELSLNATSAAEIKFTKAQAKELDVETSSAAEINGTFNVEECDLSATSAAKIDIELLAVDCYAEASSAAIIKLSGECATMEAEASSGATINAKEFCVHNHAEADASSGGDIRVNVAKSLDASASSGGEIKYIPVNNSIKLVKKTSSGGSVGL